MLCGRAALNSASILGHPRMRVGERLFLLLAKTKGIRMNIRRIFLLLLPITACLAVSPLSAGEPLSPDNFEKIHALIKPKQGEWQWAKIPWLTSLAEAQKKAAVEGKPLYVWASLGDPAGGT